MTFDLVDLGRRALPAWLRYAIQRRISLTDYKLGAREARDPLASVLRSDVNTAGSPYRFGIVRNAASYHTHYVAACLEMGVPFEVVDLMKADWVERLQAARCDVLLVWPDGFLTVWATMIKERVEAASRQLGLPVYPTLPELWLFEDKRRTAYWLRTRGIPHPQTWVFYDRKECFEFIGRCSLPIVFKACFGASGSGVRIARDRRGLKALVKESFGRGFLANGADRRDRQWGSVLLQEYLPEVREWRLVRIGESYFGHPKGRVGEFHSGSGVVLWDPPDRRLLDFLFDVTEAGGFTSMDVDAFETPDGRLLVNELQTVFGAGFSVDQLRLNGTPGRFTRGAEGAWAFEAGDFARNACANERVRFVMGLSRDQLLVNRESGL